MQSSKNHLDPEPVPQVTMKHSASSQAFIGNSGYKLKHHIMAHLEGCNAIITVRKKYELDFLSKIRQLR